MDTAYSVVSQAGIELSEAKEGANVTKMWNVLMALDRKIMDLERQPKARRKLDFELMPNSRERYRFT